MPARVQIQMALDEQLVEDTELEQALEKRLQAGDDVAEVRSVFQRADELARGLIAKHPLEDGQVIRCGRFRISKSAIPSRSVAFETDATTRIRITLTKE